MTKTKHREITGEFLPCLVDRHSIQSVTSGTIASNEYGVGRINRQKIMGNLNYCSQHFNRVAIITDRLVVNVTRMGVTVAQYQVVDVVFANQREDDRFMNYAFRANTVKKELSDVV